MQATTPLPPPIGLHRILDKHESHRDVVFLSILVHKNLGDFALLAHWGIVNDKPSPQILMQSETLLAPQHPDLYSVLSCWGNLPSTVMNTTKQHILS